LLRTSAGISSATPLSRMARTMASRSRVSAQIAMSPAVRPAMSASDQPVMRSKLLLTSS
jgi:hypothetical protein